MLFFDVAHILLQRWCRCTVCVFRRWLDNEQAQKGWYDPL